MFGDRRRTAPRPQLFAYKQSILDLRRISPKPQPLTYKQSATDRHRTPPKPQPRGGRTLAVARKSAIFGMTRRLRRLEPRSSLSRYRSFLAVLASSCFALATAPLGPTPHSTATAPHTSPASSASLRFASVGRLPRACSSRPPWAAARRHAPTWRGGLTSPSLSAAASPRASTVPAVV